MEEKQMIYNINFIKIWDNIKKYWWICLITTGLAVILAIIVTITGFRKINSMTSQEVISERDKMYQASTLVFLEQEDRLSSSILDSVSGMDDTSDAFNSYSRTYSEYVKTYIEQWNWNRSEQLMYDCTALLDSNKIINQINEKLVQQGYLPYDIILDKITMDIKPGSRCYSLVIYGDNEERVEFIANTATELLIKEAADILNLKTSRIIDEASVNLCRLNNDGTYTVITEYSELQKLKGDSPETLGLGSFVNTINILIVFLGIFIGLGIILIFVLKDKKVRSLEDISANFNLPRLGEISGNREEGAWGVLAAALLGKCDHEELNSVMITAPGTNAGTAKLMEILEDYAHNAKLPGNIQGKPEGNGQDNRFVFFEETNLLNNALAVRKAGSADGVILMITSNYDTVPDIDIALNLIRTSGGRAVGYILCK